VSIAIDIKRIQVELSKVVAARSEMELKILEREEEVSRLRSGLSIQDAKIVELEAKISDLQSK